MATCPFSGRRTDDAPPPSGGGCPYSGGGEQPPSRSFSRRSLLKYGLAALAVAPAFAGGRSQSFAAKAAKTAAGPTPVPAPGVSVPIGGLPKWSHAVGNPARQRHREGGRPDQGGPVRRHVQGPAGVRAVGRPADPARQRHGRPARAAQGRERPDGRPRQLRDPGGLHVLRPVRRPRHHARHDAAEPPADRPARADELRHGDVRPRAPSTAAARRRTPSSTTGPSPGRCWSPTWATCGTRAARPRCTTSRAWRTAPRSSAIRATTRT